MNDNQHLYVVQSDSGNHYTVRIGAIVACSGPDFAQNKHNCKHIMFVLLRLGVPSTSKVMIQDALTAEELAEIFSNKKNKFANKRKLESVQNSVPKKKQRHHIMPYLSAEQTSQFMAEAYNTTPLYHPPARNTAPIAMIRDVSSNNSNIYEMPSSNTGNNSQSVPLLSLPSLSDIPSSTNNFQ